MAKEPIKILIIDDSAEDRMIYRKLLSMETDQVYTFFEADSGGEGIAFVRKIKPDCILLDNRLPDAEGVELLSELFSASKSPLLAIIMMTGHGNESIATNALKNGAQDYLIKGELTAGMLQKAVQNAIERVALREKLENQRLEIGKKNQELIKASKFKSQFLATMSHEIRTPMNGIIGITDLLLDTPINEEQRKYLDMVRKSGDSLIKIINDILDFSKIEAGRLSLEVMEFNLPNLISESIGLFEQNAQKKGIHLTTELNLGRLTHLKSDPNRLRQILINLISNAVKFTEKGEVKVQVNFKEQDSNRIELEFRIVDTGIGIPKEKIGDLFTPFSQADVSTSRQYGGTGLGLSICKYLVEMMGGKISAVSEPRVGSTFSFTVECEKVDSITPTAPQEESTPLSVPIDQKKILIVEDNQINQIVTIRMLEKLGYQVDLAIHGQEALEKLALNKYDLVLMDCHLPVLNGYEATTEIRKKEKKTGQRVPIVALTASAMKEELERCISVGMDDYLTKPINIETLAQKLDETFSKQASKEKVA